MSTFPPGLRARFEWPVLPLFFVCNGFVENPGKASPAQRRPIGARRRFLSDQIGQVLQPVSVEIKPRAVLLGNARPNLSGRFRNYLCIYDGKLNSGALSDVDTFCSKALSGS